jgi:hypothetical protein
MLSTPTWDTMPLCVPTRLMTKPHFQIRRQEKTIGSIMDAMRRDIKLAHVQTRKVKALYHQQRGPLAR